jgi:hypothetical protein
MLQRAPPTRHDRKRECRREQMRRYRQRERDGVRIALAPFDQQVIDYLVATNWLDPALDDDPRAVGEAYYALVRDSARRDPLTTR